MLIQTRLLKSLPVFLSLGYVLLRLFRQLTVLKSHEVIPLCGVTPPAVFRFLEFLLFHGSKVKYTKQSVSGEVSNTVPCS